MKQRFKLREVVPDAIKAMVNMDTYVRSTGLNRLQLEMINIRTSQINGCAYCIDKHSRDALRQGEDLKRLLVLSAWREAKDWFSEEDQAILTLTEEVTLIAGRGVSDETFDNAVRLFGERRTGEIIMTIISMNAWNRIGVTFNMHPTGEQK